MSINQKIDLTAYSKPKSVAAEAYRTLRTNLSFAALDKECRSILLTSVSPSDGKTTTAANLAIVLAQADKRVMLVDCDMRRPMLHKVFGVENKQGLTNCLLQNKRPEEVAVHGLIDNLTIVTSGPIPPNPAEIITSHKITSLWESILESYDYLIIDSPPILAVTDAVLLSNQVDGVLLVVESGGTKIEYAKQAKEQLNRANARILGVVINKVHMRTQDYHYYYAYHQKNGA